MFFVPRAACTSGLLARHAGVKRVCIFALFSAVAVAEVIFISVVKVVGTINQKPPSGRSHFFSWVVKVMGTINKKTQDKKNKDSCGMMHLLLSSVESIIIAVPLWMMIPISRRVPHTCPMRCCAHIRIYSLHLCLRICLSVCCARAGIFTHGW